MAFLDKLKEKSAIALDKAKDAGEIGKLKLQIESAKGDIRDLYKEVGQKLVEDYPELLAEKFPDASAKLAAAREKIENLKAQIEAVKADDVVEAAQDAAENAGEEAGAAVEDTAAELAEELEKPED